METWEVQIVSMKELDFTVHSSSALADSIRDWQFEGSYSNYILSKEQLSWRSSSHAALLGML